MELDVFRQYCLAKKGVSEGMPFGEDLLVFKVLDKMFATLWLDPDQPTTNLKCEPDRAQELRVNYADIRPGYHMNKKHWNTVGLLGDVPDPLIYQLIDHSYELIVAGMTRAKRSALHDA